jgi:pimeloyl-ACP methyl ester carboxylesterase
MPSWHAIPGVWTPVRGYSELLAFLGQERFGLVEDAGEPGAGPGNLVVFAYDWRLSNRHSAERLRARVEACLERWRASELSRADAQLVFICHSMGGLAARWYIERLGGAEVTRVLVTLGTPHRGAVKALEQLVSGVRKGPGPLKADLTSFARSLPSSYQLLPEYACIETGAGGLCKTTEVDLPHLDRERVADGMRFHDELDATPPGSYPLAPVIGIRQPTWTTVAIEGETAVPCGRIGDADEGGDGTVPRLAARPKSMSDRDLAIRGVGEGHGVLAGHRSVTDQLEFVLTAKEVTYKDIAEHVHAADGERVIGVATPDLHEAGEDVAVEVAFAEQRVLQVVAVDEHAREVASELVRYGGETDMSGRWVGSAVLRGVPPGGYTICARAPDDPHGIGVAPVHTTTLVI